MASMPVNPGGGGPMTGALSQQIIQALAQRRAQMATQGGQPGSGMSQPPQESGPQNSVASEMANIQGADPQALQELFLDIKKKLVMAIPITAFRVPGVTRHVSKAVQDIDGALKEIQMALQTTGVVSHSPLGFSAASPNAPQTNPQAGGM